MMKVFVLGRRESAAFAERRLCALDDAGTLKILSALRPILNTSGPLERVSLSVLSFVILLTAHRYNVQADRLLKTCRELEYLDEHGLDRLPKLIDELIDTLWFYAGIEVTPALPESDVRSVQDLTNELFAVLAVHTPEHLMQLAQDWDHPDVLEQLQPFARDPEDYEPVFSPTHIEFMTSIEKTHCIFAPSGKYWGADDWRSADSFEANVRRFGEGLFRFMAVAKQEKFKGFAVRLPAEMSDSVESLSRTTARFLDALNRIDPAHSTCLEGPVGGMGWKFDWAGEPMFLTAFGTCYPENHPRYPYGFDHTYFFFQPDFVLRAHPSLTPEKEPVSRARILDSFNKHGMDYDNEGKEAEAERYIRPMNPCDPPVRWWRDLPARAGHHPVVEPVA
ncbi:hypothetical protein [Halothiobacillus diazotrophicus]|nr:hypothetical protein [Halothiobacillus diazotrophicus]